MMEPGWIMALWSIGTALLAAGAAFGAVRATQKQFRQALEQAQKAITKLNDKVQQIDKDYVTHPQCHGKQGDCLDHHRSWEATVTTQLTDLKTMIAVMDEKRESARFETLSRIQKEKHSSSLENDQLQTLLGKLLDKLNG